MNRVNEIISFGCRFFLAGIWILAGYYKVWDPQGFSHSVAAYNILPLWAVNFCSVIIAWLEIIIGLLFLVGLWIKPSAAWSLGLFSFYSLLMIRAGITGAVHDCGCLPGHAIPAGYMHVLPNIFFSLLSMRILRRPGSWWVIEKNQKPGNQLRSHL